MSGEGIDAQNNGLEQEEIAVITTVHTLTSRPQQIGENAIIPADAGILPTVGVIGHLLEKTLGETFDEEDFNGISEICEELVQKDYLQRGKVADEPGYEDGETIYTLTPKGERAIKKKMN